MRVDLLKAPGTGPVRAAAAGAALEQLPSA